MKKREDKNKDFEALRKELEKAHNVFLTGYEKMTVSQDFELRKSVRGAGGSYKIVKNTIAGKASEGTASEELLKDLKGMSSLAITMGDPVALAKALVAYGKTNPAFTFKAGMVEGRVIEVASIQELASLPSRDEILAKVLYLINARAQTVVSVLSAVGRNLAVVLSEAEKQGKFKED